MGGRLSNINTAAINHIGNPHPKPVVSIKETYPKIYLYRRIVQSKLFIDEHFADNIDLDKIADEAYFSKFHFIRLFKNIYNKTPHQYLTLVRIDKAKLLLQAGTGVADVCYSVGFDSVTSFTSLFKRMVHLTPSSYQQLQTKLRADTLNYPLKFIPNCFAEAKGWVKNSNFQEAII